MKVRMVRPLMKKIMEKSWGIMLNDVIFNCLKEVWRLADEIVKN